MERNETITVIEAAKRCSLNIGLPVDDEVAPKWWSFKVFGLNIYCYNFKWRQQAIAHHDLHHIVTGYPCTMVGEMQLATWEFAAGRFPNIYSNLFCLPLVTLGAVCAPGKLWSAFKNGRRSRSLFSTPITASLLNMSVAELREKVRNHDAQQTGYRDRLAFAILVGLSALPLSIPMLAWFLYADRIYGIAI